MKKTRADILLVERGLCESRTQAQRLIQSGQVRVGADHVVGKPGDLLPPDADLVVTAACPYVSRGAYKLLAGLEACPLDLHGVVALDVGASTGGFTDLLLQRGARRVYAVDCGYGQLHQRLREDPRVVCQERVNARYLAPEHVPEPVDVLTADLSFISLRKVLPAAAVFLKPGGHAFLLVKPQFESRREEVGKGGIVRDPAVQERCVCEVRTFAQAELGWECLAVVEATRGGPTANREFMAVFRARCPAIADLHGCPA